MPKRTSSSVTAPGPPAGLATSSTTTAKDVVPSFTLASVWALICLYVWFECKEKKVAKTDQIERICSELVKKHTAMFVEGRGVYDHPACDKMRSDFAFSAEELCKSSDGKTIMRKGQGVERDIKNVLIPVLYQSPLLDSPNYTIASGKNAADLLLDVKRLAWHKNGNNEEDFKDGFSLNRYHASFFPFMMASPLSEYLYERPCHVYFKACI